MRDLEAGGGGTREDHGRFVFVAVEEGGSSDAGADGNGVEGGEGGLAGPVAFEYGG